MRYRVTHRTTYSGDQPVSICHNEAWLIPRDLPHQKTDSHQLEILPVPSCQTTRVDYFGNPVAMFSFYHGFETLTVAAVSELTLRSRDVSLHEASPAWETVRDGLRSPDRPESLSAYEFAFPSPRIPVSGELAAYALSSFAPGRPILEGAVDLTERIHRDFEFDPRSTTVTTPVAEVLQHRKGVCQDFAHLQIAMLRSLGLPARYVSGYLRTHPPEGQSRLVGVDASHAWLSLFCGELGWIDLDPTNNLLPDLEHITIAWGRDYSDVCPLKGVYIGGGRNALKVGVDVTPLEDEAR
jgi:transglutaminase-like putative cysteine protease